MNGRDALLVSPRLHSVRLLYVAKRRRDKRRERIARALCVAILAGLPVLIFILATGN
jgi:hypothetical protein